MEIQPKTSYVGLGRQEKLDSANRTLLKVSMEDAGAVDSLFQVLMGDTRVSALNPFEQRREFIKRHMLEIIS